MWINNNGWYINRDANRHLNESYFSRINDGLPRVVHRIRRSACLVIRIVRKTTRKSNDTPERNSNEKENCIVGFMGDAVGRLRERSTHHGNPALHRYGGRVQHYADGFGRQPYY